MEEGESIETAAIREIWEESGVVVEEKALEKVAIIEFVFPDGKHLEVHTFFVRTWTGNPVETEEMRPQWFSYNEMPYDAMWADDKFWFPRALAGEKLIGKVWFKEDDKSIERMEWLPVNDFSESTLEQRKEWKFL